MMKNFDARNITDTIQRALASAGLDTRSGPMRGVTDTIESALAAAGLMTPRQPAGDGNTFEGTAREVPSASDDATVAEPAPQGRPGEFVERAFAGAAGARTYKLYVPARHADASTAPMPMVVMLHGCTQSPDDFAAGTRMNALADEHGFVVVYPAQPASANVQKCWNWFRSADQARASGEPAIIAGIVRDVASRHRIDERRVFVAGMSAGAAMAVILGATYPDVFAAVGAHSGLAYGAAHDVPSAFGAMRGASAAPRRDTPAIPTIVFHGDGDTTVDARNATTIVAQAIARHDGIELTADRTSGVEAGGRTYSRTTHADASGRVVAEHWILHGAGHAWSGGSPAGSYTDARGPDASREMIRFFYALPRAGTA